ncbi:MAG: O-antigen ligase family protein, partial [Rikenellaceae bacterium]
MGTIGIIVNNIKAHWFSFFGVVISMIIISAGTILIGIPFGLAITLAPLVVIFFIYLIKDPYWGIIALFFINYFVTVLIRYLAVEGLSVLFDIMVVLTFLSIIINNLVNPEKLGHRLKNGLFIVSLMWFIYCCFEIINPRAMLSAWFLSRSLIYYMLVTVMLTFLVFNKYKDLKTMLYIMSIFTLFGVAKGVMQQFWGFDAAETAFLNDGGAGTHLLNTGTRYFSFYVSAGVFGAVMGYAVVVYGISAIYIKGIMSKIYFTIVALASLYGLLISGTRGAIAIPLAGFVLFIILSKKTTIIITSTIVLVATYVFLAHTMIGQGNQFIRRTRTIFDPDEPSLVVRKTNQAILKEYLKDKPMGEGLGLSGVDAQNVSMRFTTTIPTDSWYVKLWVETGVIGLILYMLIYLYAMIYGCYLIFFKVKDRILKGLLTALMCGFFGIVVASYG